RFSRDWSSDVCSSDLTFGKRKQRVITSDTYVLAWIMLCTSLTYDDASTFSKLSAKKLNAQALAFRVTAVLGTTYTFLMCHDTICLKVLSQDKIKERCRLCEFLSNTDDDRFSSCNLYGVFS